MEVGNLFILTILTYGLYHIYWFYKNWVFLKTALDRPIRPVWRTIGLFVPFLNIFLIAQQFKNINDVAREKGCTQTYSHIWTSIAYLALSTAYAAVTILFTASMMSEAEPLTPDMLVGILYVDTMIFALLGALLIAPQRLLNEYWSKVQNLPPRKNLTTGEIAWIVFGGLFWLIGIVEVFAL